tara:strand:+ start:159 stop:341 length:183 start_codon:yes stop_codon:yes gene_type:complete
MKYIFVLFLFVLVSCGYPDIDSVPNFDDINLSDEEIADYCSNINTNKKNIDKCINNYTTK